MCSMSTYHIILLLSLRHAIVLRLQHPPYLAEDFHPLALASSEINPNPSPYPRKECIVIATPAEVVLCACNA